MDGAWIEICRNRLRRHAIIPVKKAQRLGKIVHKQNARNANLACTTSFEERKQQGHVNKFPSLPRRKSVSWWILVSFLGIWVIATSVGLNSFFSTKISFNTAHVFQTLEKQLLRKPHQSRKGIFFCFVVKLFNSALIKDYFSQLKETTQFSNTTWREWMNFYAWIHMSNFHPVKLK